MIDILVSTLLPIVPAGILAEEGRGWMKSNSMFAVISIKYPLIIFKIILFFSEINLTR